MLNCSSEKIVMRCCVLDENGYWKHRDIFVVCNSMAEIGKKAWYVRNKKLSKDEKCYFTFRKVLLA